MITNFDIKTNLKVEFYIPEAAANIFIIGVSLIGGRNVIAADGFIIGTSLIGGEDGLGTPSAYAWQPSESVVSSADFSIGGNIQSNLYFQPDSGQISLTLQSWDYDPANNSSIRAGTKIRLRLESDGVDEVIFQGYIDTFDVNYYPFGPNVISITATDIYKRFINSFMETFDTTGFPGGSVTATEVIETIADTTGYTISAESETLTNLISQTSETNVTVSEYFNNAIQTGLGISWIDPATEEIVVKARPAVTTTAPDGTYTVGNNHGDPYHLCMSQIKVSGDADSMINSLYITRFENSANTLFLSNQESIDIYGVNNESVTLSSYSLTDMGVWGLQVFNQAPGNLVSMVKTPAVDNSGNLTQAATFTPGTLIGVKYQTNNIDIDDYYTITKVSHSINVDTWYTTLELWKVF